MPHLNDVRSVQLCHQIKTLLGPQYGFLTILVDHSDGMVSVMTSLESRELMESLLDFALVHLHNDETDTQFFPASDPTNLN